MIYHRNMEKLYKIENLVCSYKNSGIVLKINELIIPSKKITVLLGVSGAGKSTILETLGLMNDTIDSGTISFYPNNGMEKLELGTVWTNKTKYISKIRNDYFSFIFQNTNLMPNFTAMENVCITQMIQGKSYEAAKITANTMMEIVGLNMIDSEKRVQELSGGQQQRLAFIRAITPDFTVLFGDEPTGNLDELNSAELMKVIKDEIKHKAKSAIIVSHNITLALEYADCIILIDKPKGKPYGEITSQSVFHKQSEQTTSFWTNNQGERIDDLKALVQKYLNGKN